MTDYFVGPGGNNSNSGLTWALRWLDFTNVTTGNFPASGGNRLIVGPGTYRQTLTCRPGASGNRHEYRGDPTGFLTDGVGGVIRVTGSNNDTSATRSTCITSADNTIVSGFWLDLSLDQLIGTTFDNSILEDCVFTSVAAQSTDITFFTFGSNETATIRRCYIDGYGSSRAGIRLYTDSGTNVFGTNVAVENCILKASIGVETYFLYGNQIRANTLLGRGRGVGINNVTTEGVTTITHNVFWGRNTEGIRTTSGSSHVEDWNQFNGTLTPRVNIDAGANSTTVPRHSYTSPFHLYKGLLLAPPTPVGPTSLSVDRYSGDTGTGIPTTDFFGISRPTAHAKRSLGAIQFHDVRRSTTQVRSGATSLQLADAARHQIRVPYTGLGTVTVKVYVRRESDYAGTLPGMVIKQPWRSDTTVVDTGSANAWNLIQTNYTPTSGSRWFIVELYSDNTASSGAYNVWFDDLDITNA